MTSDEMRDCEPIMEGTGRNQEIHARSLNVTVTLYHVVPVMLLIIVMTVFADIC